MNKSMKYLKMAFRGTAYTCFTLFFIAAIIILYEDMFLELWNKSDGIGTMLISIAFYLLMVLLCTIMYFLVNSLVNLNNFFGKFLDNSIFKALGKDE